MKKGIKIALGVGCGSLLVLGIIVVVAGYFGLNYVEKQLGESVQKFDAEGRQYGAATDKQGCMEEGVRRSKAVGLVDMSGGMALSAFVDACLETSRPTNNFCEGVPSFWSMKESDWGAAECRKSQVDPTKTGCVHVMKRKHEFCNRN